MKEDLFLRMFLYKTSEKKTQLENYTTELFVFLIQYLIINNKKVVNKVLSEFGFEEPMDFKELSIDTQTAYYVKETKVLPDIAIRYKDSTVFIEVKVDANLNGYTLDKQSYNQIELYERIDGVSKKKVFLLSKNTVQGIEKSKRILWSRIYEILDDEDDFVVRNFLVFLKENGMASIKLTKDVLRLVQTFNDFQLFLKSAWQYEKYELTFNHEKGCWVGFYVSQKGKKMFWFGQKDGDPENLAFHVENEGLRNKIKKSGTDIIDSENIISRIPLNEIVEKKTSEAQREILCDWFREIIENKLEPYL